MARESQERYTLENESYKSVIRKYVKSQLIEPLRRYPTTIGDTLLYVITKRLEELYLYTVRFPEIVSPDYNRMDILQAIVEQFEFTIRTDADIEEQIDILDNILYVYRKRGSIDTIENMWKYYGGNLPKDIKVKIPSYNLFRYNISKLSGTHVFQDGDMNRAGVYEVVLNNATNYSVEELKEFMLSELVAAGNRIFFTHSLYSMLTGDSSYNYDVQEDTFIHTQMQTVSSQNGLVLSESSALSNSPSARWSGKPNIFVDILKIGLLFHLDLSESYKPLYFFKSTVREFTSLIDCCVEFVTSDTFKNSLLNATYTLEEKYVEVQENSYDRDGNLLTNKYPGYFILASTLLGNEV